MNLYVYFMRLDLGPNQNNTGPKRVKMSRAMTHLDQIPAGLSLEDYAARLILSAWVLTGSDGFPSSERLLSRAVQSLHAKGVWPSPLQDRIYITERFDGPEWENLPRVLQHVQSISLAGFNNPGFHTYSLKIDVADAIEQCSRLDVSIDDLEQLGAEFRLAIREAGRAFLPSSAI